MKGPGLYVHTSYALKLLCILRFKRCCNWNKLWLNKVFFVYKLVSLVKCKLYFCIYYSLMWIKTDLLKWIIHTIWCFFYGIYMARYLLINTCALQRQKKCYMPTLVAGYEKKILYINAGYNCINLYNMNLFLFHVHYCIFIPNDKAIAFTSRRL